jgi:hypothetical protein
MRARAAALTMHSQGKTNTKPARLAYMARFEHQVDPDKILDPAERAKRADQAHRAHMTRLAYRSAIARRNR